MSRPELASDPADEVTTVLVPGIKGIELAYFGLASADEAPNWHDGWDEPAHPPELVRVSVRFLAGDFRQWPEFVVAPQIAADANCIYDALSHACKGRWLPRAD